MSEHLESIYPQLNECCPKREEVTYCATGGSGGKFAYFILWWVILVVIIWFIIYSLQPSWVMKDNNDCSGDSCKKKCEVDQGKAVLVSVIIALIIILLFYFASSRCGW